MRQELRLKKELPGITEEVLRSYKQSSIGNHIASTPLPSKTEAVQILKDVLEVLFPGYIGKQDLLWSNVRYFVGGKLDELYTRLALQIWRCIRHECKRLGSACVHCEDKAEEDSLVFLRKLPEIREMLVEDVQAAHEGDPAAKSIDEIIFSYPCLQAIGTYRIAHELYLLGVPLLPRMMTEWAHGQTGIDIHPAAKIGRRFFIDHGTGVVIGETCVIGNNVRIYQGVTLGAMSLENVDAMRGQKRHPTIEDDVTIYSGTTILGDNTIGKGSVVGGNVWLTQSVPAHTKVFVEPPKHLFKVSRKAGGKGKGKRRT
ncbi:MAG: serine O-acetyltransferase EpsC [Planctomycetota bacterium]